jgi:hypothetical protein
VSGIAHIPDDDSRAAVFALTALAAADWRDALLGQRCVDELESLGERTIAVGFGSLVLGPAALYTGVAQLAVGHLDRARALLERGVQLSIESTGRLWEAHARLWLAETLLERRTDGDLGEAMANIRAVTGFGFPEGWRIGRHATLLCDALAEGVQPALLRDRVRHLRSAS